MFTNTILYVPCFRMFLINFIKVFTLCNVFLYILNCTPARSKKNELLFIASLVAKANQSQIKSSNCNYFNFDEDSGEDPYLISEWHLNNSGEDLNLGSVWNTNRGDHIRVAVVDDGLDIYHEDLNINVVPQASYNFGVGYQGYSNSIYDPYSTSAAHGTAVGGVIGARDKNGKGVSGIAPRACLVGYNVLANSTDANQGYGMNYLASEVSVSNNSWGAPDGTGQTSERSFLWSDGIETGLTQGRDKKGTVYIWAAGNGANLDHSVSVSGSFAYPLGNLETDNSNQDGQANFYGVMAICGLTDDGKRVEYSEKGSNLWVCGYSQKTTFATSQDGIWTTDISNVYGYNPLPSSLISSGYSQIKQIPNFNYSKIFNGTSGAAPMASATVALMIKANPELGWRDVKIILAESARKNDPLDSDWVSNFGTKISDPGSFYHLNHKYGFGVIDISRATTLAETWKNVGPLLTYDTGTIVANSTFTNHTTLLAGTSSHVTVTSSNTQITKIEFIDVTVSTTNADASDLEIVLISPSGSSSTLSEAHICASESNRNPTTSSQTTACGNYSNWVFGSARHLGESPVGVWTIQIADRRPGTGSTTGWGNGGTLSDWSLKFYGRAE